MIKAGAVTVVVTTLKSGLKNMDKRKKIPTQTAVKPDRPPAAMSVMAYITNELAGGEPIYESLAGRMQTKEDNDYVGEADQLTFSVFEGSQMAGKKIKEIAWPDRTLVKVIHRGQKDIIPDGNTQLVVGDLVVLELDENQRGVIYDEVARLQNEK